MSQEVWKTPGLPDPGAYDLIAELYDWDMGLNNDGKDVVFYLATAHSQGSPILELGCGTGRITIPLVQGGLAVVGIDRSLPMLQQMKKKGRELLSPWELKRLQCCCMDMSDWAVQNHYAMIFSPYSSFTYLTKEEDRLRCLETVRSHLRSSGLFVLDCFIPHYDFLALPDNHLYADYHRALEDGRFLERKKTVQKDLTAQLNTITRYYRVYESDGVMSRSITTQETIRYFFHEELKLYLQANGFQIVGEYGGFEGQSYRYQCQTMVFICKPR